MYRCPDTKPNEGDRAFADCSQQNAGDVDSNLTLLKVCLSNGLPQAMSTLLRPLWQVA